MPLGFPAFVYVVMAPMHAGGGVHSLHFTWDGAQSEVMDALGDCSEGGYYWSYVNAGSCGWPAFNVKDGIKALIKYGSVELYCDGVHQGFTIEAREVEA